METPWRVNHLPRARPMEAFSSITVRVANNPRHTNILGWINLICASRYPRQAATSPGLGSRLPEDDTYHMGRYNSSRRKLPADTVQQLSCPTYKGNPCWSSSWPGPSPTNIDRPQISTPTTTCLHPAQTAPLHSTIRAINCPASPSRQAFRFHAWPNDTYDCSVSSLNGTSSETELAVL